MLKIEGYCPVFVCFCTKQNMVGRKMLHFIAPLRPLVLITRYFESH